MSIAKKDLDREAAVAKLKNIVQSEKVHKAPANLDDLIELLNADDLRNVTVMIRPKGQPAGIERK
ncbi:hypothetical protein SAMN04515617_107264 [Collimonas sp. OK242]|jgi:hypothetical protein|uniref:hypothetical protein n=1 Tax=Collimonas sp. OK242 TaxID=1798195 RepID=UPI0008942BFE|nr:hypothetical protein [Collimonas sp. OK242]SDX87147.1 hypothetical protein SAMN04515617_107264 [Collimonas sp. OK242]